MPVCYRHYTAVVLCVSTLRSLPEPQPYGGGVESTYHHARACEPPPKTQSANVKGRGEAAAINRNIREEIRDKVQGGEGGNTIATLLGG